jgi:hypothetical protein
VKTKNSKRLLHKIITNCFDCPLRIYFKHSKPYYYYCNGGGFMIAKEDNCGAIEDFANLPNIHKLCPLPIKKT